MKKRIFSLLLTCTLAAALIPAASAADVSPDEIPDVFQGDGLYITVTPWEIKNNSEGWALAKELNSSADENCFHDGYIAVHRSAEEVDDFGYLTGRTVEYMNYVDTEGNLLDLSGWENPLTFQNSMAFPFSEGMAVYYDDETGLFGYMNDQGERVIPAQFKQANAFSDGLAKVTAFTQDGDTVYQFIDSTGTAVLTINGAVGDRFNCGLVPYQGQLDGGDYFVGYLDKKGQPAITLYRGESSGYDEEDFLGLMLLTTEGDSCFSADGHAILRDARGGRTYPAYVIIDTNGNQTGVLDAAPPAYVKLLYHSRSIHDSRLPVSVGSGMFDRAEVIMDVQGNEVFRVDGGSYGEDYGPFDSGVSTRSGSDDEEDRPIVVDARGNTVIPALKDFVKTEAYYVGLGQYQRGYYVGCDLDHFHDGASLMVMSRSGPSGGDFDQIKEYYVLEVHQGTYTGSGTVYNAATGQVTGSGTAPSIPADPSVDGPSSWAAEQVNTAIAAGIVPESLQGKYTQAATRAEFCALAVELYETVTGMEITQRTTFTDTTDENVEKMAGLGVVTGVGEGRFSPDGTLTREQAATMLSRLAAAMGSPLTMQAPTFADNTAISSWAFDAVGQMQGSGIMGGVGDNAFDPQGSYSREQSMLTMLRLYESMS